MAEWGTRMSYEKNPLKLRLNGAPGTLVLT